MIIIIDNIIIIIIISFGHLAEIRWPICISKSQKNMCATFSKVDSGYDY